MFQAVLLSVIFCSISVDKPWFRILDDQSPDYFTQLFCGTVARGRVNIGEKRSISPVDLLGFFQGVAKILELSEASTDSLPLLNTTELNWLREKMRSSMSDSALTETYPKNFLRKMLLSLFRLKTYPFKTTTLASLLAAAKKHQLIFDPEIQSKSIEYLKQLPFSPDPLCFYLRQSLIQFVETPILIPDFQDKDYIRHAIERSFNFFPDTDNKGKESLVLAYYAFAEYAEYQLNPQIL
jgi:hypothetical protein